MSAIVQDRIVRVNGARVMLIDARKALAFEEDESGRWVTWCDRHETFVHHTTRRDAQWHAVDPTTWCGLCAEGLD